MILEELNRILGRIGIPIETGVFSDKAPEQYMVLIPLADTFDLFADNRPERDVQEVRISIFSKGSYTKLKNAVVKTLLEQEFTITAREYLGFETDSGYHHYVVDVAQHYETED